MTRFKDREQVLKLRKDGWSYSQIKKVLKIGKSTLSSWLKNYPLSKARISELRDNNAMRIEKFRETMRHKKELRLKNIYSNQKKIITPLNKHEILIAGLFLYWGEGSKYKTSSLAITNTDHSIIKFFIHWLNTCFKVSINKIKIDLQLYNDMTIDEELLYWSKKIKIPLSQFSHPHIKKTSQSRINHKGGFGHGTCSARIGDARLTETVLMSLKTIADLYN